MVPFSNRDRSITYYRAIQSAEECTTVTFTLQQLRRWQLPDLLALMGSVVFSRKCEPYTTESAQVEKIAKTQEGIRRELDQVKANTSGQDSVSASGNRGKKRKLNETPLDFVQSKERPPSGNGVRKRKWAWYYIDDEEEVERRNDEIYCKVSFGGRRDDFELNILLLHGVYLTGKEADESLGTFMENDAKELEISIDDINSDAYFVMNTLVV